MCTHFFCRFWGMLQLATGWSLYKSLQAWQSDLCSLMSWATMWLGRFRAQCSSPVFKTDDFRWIQVNFMVFYHGKSRSLPERSPISSNFEAALASCAWQSLWRSALAVSRNFHADQVTINTVAGDEICRSNGGWWGWGWDPSMNHVICDNFTAFFWLILMGKIWENDGQWGIRTWLFLVCLSVIGWWFFSLTFHSSDSSRLWDKQPFYKTRWEHETKTTHRNQKQGKEE